MALLTLTINLKLYKARENFQKQIIHVGPPKVLHNTGPIESFVRVSL